VTGQVLKVTAAGRSSRSAGRRGVTFVRTVLGYIDPGELGVTHATSIVIDGGRPVELPDFRSPTSTG
jgi:hypothetical protein